MLAGGGVGSRMSDMTAKVEEKASDRRTFKGLLVKPREQIKYSFIFMGGGMLILTIFIGVVMFSLNRTLVSVEIAYGLDPEVASAIRSSLTATLSIALLLSAVLSASAILLGLQMSHRLYGPLVPIQRHISEMKSGNFSTRIQLRKNDELLELQEALNDLAEHFGKKAAPKS